MTRTFIALEMNTALQRHLTTIRGQVAQLLPGIRWVEPAGIHLTLAFLGELTDEQLVQAQQATEQAASSAHPFSFQLTRFGTFGSPRQPRVIWLGIDIPSGLTQLHHRLQQELISAGFEVEKRPFAPHLTLARVKNPLSLSEQQILQDLLQSKEKIKIPSAKFPVQHIAVMKSELLRTGAQYTCLHLASLGRH